ncbi:MAG: DNA alkylation repair protein [Methanothrix sp.]|jgi:3-methyladenine DNA glycosylase AlkD|nr:DNA alkylation repair protein [Methanothrix sp.]
MERDVLAAVRQELLQSIDEKTRESAQRFFKEEVKFHGVKIAAVKKIAAKYFREIKGRDKNEIFSLCEDLLQAGFGEEAFIAFEWSYSLRRAYEPEDFAVFERWVDLYVDNWAKCDTLCNHTLGSFVEMYPQFIDNMAVWARAENRWLRRASAATLILPARKGAFLKEVFEISDILLMDRDDMVQKGYGWLLKEASKKHQAEVFDYVMRWKAKMPRTALRYAIEKMPVEMKKKAMER